MNRIDQRTVCLTSDEELASETFDLAIDSGYSAVQAVGEHYGITYSADFLAYLEGR